MSSECTFLFQVYLGSYRDKEDLKSRLDRIIQPVYHGGTNILVALRRMRRMFRDGGRFTGTSYNRYIAIFITDGDDHQLEQVRSEASEAHDDGIVIISIGVLVHIQFPMSLAINFLRCAN